MRFVLLLAALLLYAAPSRAAEAPASAVATAATTAPPPADSSPDSLETGDWVAVAGIVCYGIVPAVILVAVLFLSSAFVRDVYSLPAAAQWLAPLRLGVRPRELPPPRGLILLRF